MTRLTDIEREAQLTSDKDRQMNEPVVYYT